jgi:hypothetical protein
MRIGQRRQRGLFEQHFFFGLATVPFYAKE